MREVLLLEPVDVWSFRDGRPFEAGESYEARSLFPPHPWTVLGCLRTALLRKHCPDPERYAGRGSAGLCPRCGPGPCAAIAAVGQPGGEAPFAIWPPLLARMVAAGPPEVFFPTPRDLARESDRGGLPVLLKPVECADGVAHSLGAMRPVGSVGPARLFPWKGEWIGREVLVRCLAGELPDGASPSAPTVWREPRIGVGIDPGTRAAKRGQLYLRDAVRLEDGPGGRVGLLVGVAEETNLDGEVARLGGDGRMVTIRSVSAPPAIPAAPLERRVKPYLVSPTFFEGGWRPGWVDPSDLEGRVPGSDVRVRVEGVATGDPVMVGGWDLKNQRPRTLTPLVPAGSVYFLRVTQGEPEALARVLHGRTLCDDTAMAKAGFGLVFVGRY